MCTQAAASPGHRMRLLASMMGCTAGGMLTVWKQLAAWDSSAPGTTVVMACTTRSSVCLSLSMSSTRQAPPPRPRPPLLSSLLPAESVAGPPPGPRVSKPGRSSTAPPLPRSATAAAGRSSWRRPPALVQPGAAAAAHGRRYAGRAVASIAQLQSLLTER